VNAFRRLLLLLLMCALPVQGALAASRLCMASLHPSDAGAGASVAHEGHASGQPASAHRGNPPGHVAHRGDAAGHAAHHGHSAAHAAQPAATPDTDPAEPLQPADHAADTCKLCAACCLTVAVAPPVPYVVAIAAAFSGFRSVAVAVVHNVADGLERPPRTI
jgi:hypothetical protein